MDPRVDVNLVESRKYLVSTGNRTSILLADIFKFLKYIVFRSE